MLIAGRAVVFLITTLALAPGLMANLILKDHWGRPRPYTITEFNGDAQFIPWWDPRGGCDANCSFVAGEGASSFWTLAPAALAPPAWRALIPTNGRQDPKQRMSRSSGVFHGFRLAKPLAKEKPPARHASSGS